MSISLVLQYDCLRGMWAFPDAEAPTFPTLRAPAAFQSFLWIRGRAQESSTGKPVVPFQRERERGCLAFERFLFSRFSSWLRVIQWKIRCHHVPLNSGGSLRNRKGHKNTTPLGRPKVDFTFSGNMSFGNFPFIKVRDDSWHFSRATPSKGF